MQTWLQEHPGEHRLSDVAPQLGYHVTTFYGCWKQHPGIFEMHDSLIRLRTETLDRPAPTVEPPRPAEMAPAAQEERHERQYVRLQPVDIPPVVLVPLPPADESFEDQLAALEERLRADLAAIQKVRELLRLRLS